MIDSSSTILITGASQGIGRYLAIHFSQRVAKVLLLARNADGLRATAEAVEAVGGRCECYVADLSEFATLESAVRTILSKSEQIDVIIHNAADVTSKPLCDTTPQEIDHLVATNVTGPLQLSRMLLPPMLERGKGAIVHISSLAGYKPNPQQTVYSITKSAVNAMSDALRAELKGTPVHVMNVALASVDLENAGAPSKTNVANVAAAIEKGLEARRDEIHFSALTKWLMRLYRFFPALMKLK